MSWREATRVKHGSSTPASMKISTQKGIMSILQGATGTVERHVARGATPASMKIRSSCSGTFYKGRSRDRQLRPRREVRHGWDSMRWGHRSQSRFRDLLALRIRRVRVFSRAAPTVHDERAGCWWVSRLGTVESQARRHDLVWAVFSQLIGSAVHASESDPRAVRHLSIRL